MRHRLLLFLLQPLLAVGAVALQTTYGNILGGRTLHVGHRIHTKADNAESGGPEIPPVPSSVPDTNGDTDDESDLGDNLVLVDDDTVSAERTRPPRPLVNPLLPSTRCNGYTEFCGRRYSNVSMVGAHNSPFAVRHNLAANQERNVTDQLNDGVRFLQAQIQWVANDTQPHFCHTSCALLDAGPITTWLTTVSRWVAAHPHDVVTILLGNGNYSAPSMYAPHIVASGLVPYAFVPPKPSPPQPPGLYLDEWPTLGEMIAAGQRVVLMLDYKADETEYPWLLDEFTYLWENPFDPIVDTLPNCSVQRPPDLSEADAADRLYLMNHNLNVEVTFWDFSFMIPALALANQTNAASGNGSLGEAATACTQRWSRPPNVIDVDFYNRGTPSGSVFAVAAKLNNVTYNGTCCSAPDKAGAGILGAPLWLVLGIVLGQWMWLL